MKNNKLTAKEHIILMEALRRYIRFGKPNKETLKDSWTGLGNKTEYESVIKNGLMTWVYGTPQKRSRGWLSLTKKGCAIVQSWLDAGYNNLYFDGNWEHVVNEKYQIPSPVVYLSK